jgi:hypothetical protein
MGYRGYVVTIHQQTVADWLLNAHILLIINDDQFIFGY